LEPSRTVTRVDAVVFGGGSAFGLAAADGVTAWLAEHGRGLATRHAVVPIVPTATIYDRAESDAAPPGPDAGRAAIEAAGPGAWTGGRIGAGTGATVGKWRGTAYAAPGGVGIASAPVGDATIAALAVVNAVGDVIGDDGQTLAGSSAGPEAATFPEFGLAE